MAVKDRHVALPDLVRVRRDDDLRREVLAASRRLVLRVRRDVATPDVLDSDVPDVEPNVSPGFASESVSWCISTDLHSDSKPHGANRIIIPGFRTPVSTRPTGTVPIPEIL